MRYSRLIELIAATIATVLNLMLIPIIIMKSSPKMGRYKYLLLAYTVSACCYVFTISTALFFEIVLFCTLYIATLLIIDWSFIYRLSIIDGFGNSRNRRNLKFRSSKRTAKLRYISVAVLGIVIILAVIMITVVFMAPTAESDAVFREEVLSALGLDMEQIGYIGGQIIVYNTQATGNIRLQIDGHIHLGIITLILVCSVFFFISFVVYIICWYRIGVELRRLRNIPNSSYRLHRKCYLLLTLQTCVPITFNLLPCGVIITLYFLNVSYSEISHYCATVLSFAQIMDPLFTIFFIVEYKRFLFKTFNKLFCVNRVSTEITSTTQNSSTNQRFTSNISN